PFENCARIILVLNKSYVEVVVRNIFVWIIWLIINLIVVGAASYPLFTNVNEYIWGIFGVCIYFVLFFISPLFYKRLFLITIIHCLKIIIILITFFLIEYDLPYYFLPILIGGLVIGEAAERLPSRNFFAILTVGILGVLLIWLSSDFTLIERVVSIIFLIVSGAGIVYYYTWRNYHRELE